MKITKKKKNKKKVKWNCDLSVRLMETRDFSKTEMKL